MADEAGERKVEPWAEYLARRMMVGDLRAAGDYTAGAQAEAAKEAEKEPGNQRMRIDVYAKPTF